MSPLLPDDILYLISTQLLDQREFNTLFNCSIASKSLAIPALSNLYRMQDVAPVKSGGGDDAQRLGQDPIAGWAKLWRSIILASLGKTAYSYCRYVRVLDLRDLSDLLDDVRFREKYSSSFFSGDLAQFLVEMDTPVHPKTRKRRPKRLDSVAILEKIGEVLTQQTPMVEELSGGAGGFSSACLTRWIPRLRNLRQLRLWDALKLKEIGPILNEHCPRFSALKFYTALGPEADACVGKFLDDLRPNSFESLEVFSTSEIGDVIFSSLNRHNKTVSELKLGRLSRTVITTLSKAKDCTALASLHLSLSNSPEIQDVETHVLGIVSWLLNCSNLRDISFDNFDASLQILTPLVMDANIHLTRIALSNYFDSSQALAFYKALHHQAPSLRSLFLRADGETTDSDELVFALSKLHNLTDLRLQNISDYFQDQHIISLAVNMPLLEDFWVSGWSITDAVLPTLSELQSIRRLDINAFSSFTLGGILDFLSRLGPGCRGLSLAIMMADPSSPLSEEDQALVREALAAQVEGRFEYTLARDPEAPDSPSSESD